MEQVTLLDWTQLGKVECIHHYDNVLFVGSSDGHLYQYGILNASAERLYNSMQSNGSYGSEQNLVAAATEGSANGTQEQKLSTQLAKNKLSKTAITAIEIDTKRNLIFLLMDSCVSMFELERQKSSSSQQPYFKLKFVCTLKETKGCTGFALNLGETYDTFKGYIVTVLKKKSIVIAKYWREGENPSIDLAGAEYQREFKLPLPENIQKVVWVNQYIFLSLKTLCVAISSVTGQQDNSIISSLSLSNLIADEKTKYLPASKIIGPFTPVSPVFPTESPQSVEFCFPFLVSCSNKNVEIFNMYEQAVMNKHKLSAKPQFTFADQTRVFVVLKGKILSFIPPPIDVQIRSMIHNNRILQAFGMFDKTFRGTEDEYLHQLAEYKEEAGFACFFRTRYKEAFNYFSESNIDTRDIIYYFSDLTPDSFIHQPTTVKGDLKKKIKEAIRERGQDPSDARVAIRLKQAKKSLLQYLEKMRNPNIDPSKPNELKAQQAIDYALCYLYLKEVKNYGELKQLLRRENNCVYEDVAPLFEENAVFKAFLCWSKNRRTEALDILKQLGDGKVVEKSANTNGVPETVELLLESDDHSLIFKYAPHAFDVNDTEAVKMFTSKKVTASPERVLDFLSIHPADIQRAYLEFLIFDMHNKEEKYHNDLIFNYINSIEVLKPRVYLPHGVRVQAGMEGGTLGELRSNLLKLLRSDKTYYNVNKVLRRLKTTSLYEEMIVLFRALENHEDSLKLLVHNIEDFEWAERYCIEVHEEEKERLQKQLAQNRSTQLEEKLTKLDYNPFFLILLEICFHSEPRNEQLGLFILKSHAKEIHPVECLRILPDKMTLSELEVYLRQSMQHTFDREKQSELVYNLQNINHVQYDSLLARGLSRRVVIKENTMCPVCSKAIGSSSVVAVFPCNQMAVVHYKCCNKQTMDKHPITGRDFFLFQEPIRISESQVLNPKSSLM